MRKVFTFILIALLSIPVFAERKTRVDEFGNKTVKIIWNSIYTLGPENDVNWAANLKGGDGWTSILCYAYLFDPKTTKGNSRTVITLYSDYIHSSYMVTGEQCIEGAWEKYYQEEFYNYNAAYDTFKFMTAACEAPVSDAWNQISR